MFRINSRLICLTAATSLATLLSACGSSGSDGTGENAPPRDRKNSTADGLALESGTYYIDRVWDLSDGCGTEPMNAQDPITAAAYTVTNAGDGRVTLDSCSYGGTSTIGDILGNNGVLHVSHMGRRDNYGNVTAVYDQDCRIEVAVTADNTFQGTFTERQSGRNQDLRDASGISADTCTTSYKYTMSKRS